MTHVRMLLVFALVGIAGCGSSDSRRASNFLPPASTPAVLPTPTQTSALKEAKPRTFPTPNAKWKIGNAPAILQPAKTGQTWPSGLSSWLDTLASVQRSYGTHTFATLGYSGEDGADDDPAQFVSQFRKWHMQVAIAYGLFGMQNDSPLDWHETVSNAFLLPSHRKVMIAWVLPPLKRAFATMPEKDRKEYRKALAHAQGYLDGFDPHSEERYLRSLTGEECRSQAWQKKYYRLPPFMRKESTISCTTLFTDAGPDDKEENPYRKLEAFIYRRYREGWKVADMKETLGTLIAELAPAQ